MELLQDEHRILKEIITIIRSTFRLGSVRYRPRLEDLIRREFGFWHFKCPLCIEWKHRKEFPKDNSRKYKIRAYCNDCDKLIRVLGSAKNAKRRLITEKRLFCRNV